MNDLIEKIKFKKNSILEKILGKDQKFLVSKKKRGFTLENHTILNIIHFLIRGYLI